jgi:hypothetical protein
MTFTTESAMKWMTYLGVVFVVAAAMAATPSNAAAQSSGCFTCSQPYGVQYCADAETEGMNWCEIIWEGNVPHCVLSGYWCDTWPDETEDALAAVGADGTVRPVAPTAAYFTDLREAGSMSDPALRSLERNCRGDIIARLYGEDVRRSIAQQAELLSI